MNKGLKSMKANTCNLAQISMINAELRSVEITQSKQQSDKFVQQASEAKGTAESRRATRRRTAASRSFCRTSPSGRTWAARWWAPGPRAGCRVRWRRLRARWRRVACGGAARARWRRPPAPDAARAACCPGGAARAPSPSGGGAPQLVGGSPPVADLRMTNTNCMMQSRRSGCECQREERVLSRYPAGLCPDRGCNSRGTRSSW